ncbi:MAG TPA: glycogen debranching protein GlgX [Vicinamibacterales bacterium]|nr:glycogen debranching protein GlgX [Vicinamibacterales bacterium]
MTTAPGRPAPLGAHWDGAGVNFAIAAPSATRVDLCLFEAPEAERARDTVEVAARAGDVWHVYLPGVAPGQLYGYRVHGPRNPDDGQRFDASKILLDPYAAAIGRPFRWHPSLFSRDGDGDRLAPIDSAPFAPLAAVIDPAFDWGGDRPPRTPWHETTIYELHVKGFTALHAGVDPALRGTYLGLASDAAIAHLLALGVTAVELLPVHAHADEESLVGRGLTNYWGYNTLACFAPSARLAAARRPGDVVREFKTMVKRLHAAGLEVILDVVYNHTAEGDHTGPTVSWRGIDNASYYRLQPDRRARYQDFTGCGNTVNSTAAIARQMILDSLRYWVIEMHVDGFRFDLASALARGRDAFDRASPFFAAIADDPVLTAVKLIAEPWDATGSGYQVGNFPPPWSEWNGRYRDAVRRFWRGDRGMLPELATRIAGSSDLYADDRLPSASINFVTSHDGFTLADLVAYEQKHNLANGEDNRDGESNNLSWNCGVEGPTADRAILDLRERQQRNFIATLFVSQGVPMLSGGDEVGRTQQGNNNAYCHDSPLSWTPWDVAESARRLHAFVARLIALRRAHPALRRQTFLNGEAPLRDVRWLRPEGGEFNGDHWDDGDRQTIGVLLDGTAISETDRGMPVTDDSLLLLFNAAADDVPFALPLLAPGSTWTLVVDTAHPEVESYAVPAAATLTLVARSVAVLIGKPDKTGTIDYGFDRVDGYDQVRG